MKKSLFAFLFISLAWSACKDDNVDDLYKAPCVVPDTVSFTTDLQAILNIQCGATNNGCHDASNSIGTGGSNGSLADYDGTVETINDCTPEEFMKRITHDASIPSSKWMPKNGSKLDDCSISKIRRWIDQGTLNN